MSDELTPRRTLESLRKEAKRWLAAIRNGDADAIARFRRSLPDAPVPPTLRGVQLALARESGFQGWAGLKTRLESAESCTRMTLERIEREVDALLEAYRTGTPEAMERHWGHTWHRRSWPAMRTYVQLDLGRQSGTPGIDDDITVDDARYLVARSRGFTDWTELVRTAMTSARAATTDARIEPSPGPLTDERLAAMPLEEVTQLELAGTAITDRGLQALSRAVCLEELNLSHTAVTDEGIAVLRHCPMLRKLDLRWTTTGDGAIRALGGHERLRFFYSGQRVTDAGLQLFHAWPALVRWEGAGGGQQLTSDEPSANNLFLRGRFTDDGLRHLNGLDGLAGLDVEAAELGLTSRGIGALASLPHLERLAVYALDEMMPSIAALPGLRFFSCQDTIAGDVGFEALARSRTIQFLWGRRCHNLRDRGFVALSRMPALRRLAVSCLNVSDDALASLPEFPALAELMPMDIPDEGYRHIGRCTRLEALTLMYCRETGDRATEHLAGLPRLRKYFASYNRITDRTPRLLSTMDTLEEVTFSACAGITDEGVVALARLPRLRELQVSGRQVTPAIVNRFGPGVRVSFST